MSETFGTTLRRIRLERNLTQEDVARMINYDHATISKIENGKAATRRFAQICDSKLEANGQLLAMFPPDQAEPAAPAPVPDIQEVAARAWAADQQWIGDLSGPADERLLVAYQHLLAALDQVGRSRRAGSTAKAAREQFDMMLSHATADPAARGACLNPAGRMALLASWLHHEDENVAEAGKLVNLAGWIADHSADSELAGLARIRHAELALCRVNPDPHKVLGLAAEARQYGGQLLEALSAHREAQAYAYLNRTAETLAALARAPAFPDEVPLPHGPWTMPDSQAAVTGWCMFELGNSPQAVQALRKARASHPDPACRTRAILLARLARAQLADRDLDAAEENTRLAIDLAISTGSATAWTDLNRLAEDLRNWFGRDRNRALSVRNYIIEKRV